MTQPAYLTEHLVAFRLARKVTWLRSNREKLEREGFPRKDPLVGLTLTVDFEAWIELRRRIANPNGAAKAAHHSNTPLSGENLDAF
jgi:hypothetical protein